MDLKRPNQCRCCLAENRKLKNMTDLLVGAQKQKTTIICCYSACSGIDLSHSEPEISKSICKSCEKKLIIAYEFRELCQESDRVLQEQARLLATVKKEDLSDEESSQAFNQVFLEVQSEVAPSIPVEVIKIEDDSPKEAEQTPKQEEKMEIDDEAVKSPESDDNWNDNYEPDDVSSANEEEKDEKQEEPTTDCIEIDEMPGKILCFQCDLVLNSIGDYKAHRIACTGSRYKQYCSICNEAV
jgi:Zinc-finger associated domain (zf-AD)